MNLQLIPFQRFLSPFSTSILCCIMKKILLRSLSLSDDNFFSGTCVIFVSSAINIRSSKKLQITNTRNRMQNGQFFFITKCPSALLHFCVRNHSSEGEFSIMINARVKIASPIELSSKLSFSQSILSVCNVI
jgi:hypothetical protein